MYCRPLRYILSQHAFAIQSQRGLRRLNLSAAGMQHGHRGSRPGCGRRLLSLQPTPNPPQSRSTAEAVPADDPGSIELSSTVPSEHEGEGFDGTASQRTASSAAPPQSCVLPPTEASHGDFPGAPPEGIPFTSSLHVVAPEEHVVWPVYRVLETDGRVRSGALVPDLDQAVVRRMYHTMVRLQAMDTIFYNAQRQGRISFYITCTGEEATHVGSAAALRPEDPVLAQYREGGVLMWRGFTLDQFADQCFSNRDDLGKGRQMPIHYGTAALHFQTISSPLATQIPHAVGAAYGIKLEDASKSAEDKRCVICFFGEGAASEGDFHAALNFAATLQAPVLFFCRNNGYAISTPVKEQFRGDGVVSRAPGYGMHALRVDGNDVLAVYHACQAAREVCVREGKPVLVEAITYRVGHHSTSDDSTRYRSLSEIKQWHGQEDPLRRFRAWMEGKGWWSDEDEVQLRDEERMAVLRALERAEVKPKPGMEALFEDVYREKPWHLREQEAGLRDHVEKYPDVYKEGTGKGH
ncbi:2-oxoisovalerate dehydrogenase alpha mitochondrial expressed [Nannochloropsis gaditana]|uniref:2-oxoisovalerate dehydrogenase subunit alpha n=1 Tax=Nannochloropsis gaditana TaxID=72520 RepID=W7TXE9_9STRA|nr:2-oxoisovalerate dehydrogenase alpha mitochondrial expressed [Nannochloropsis gaditana]